MNASLILNTTLPTPVGAQFLPNTGPVTDTSGAMKGNKQSSSIYKNAWQPMYAIRFEIIVNNVFNHTNLATPIGNLNSTFFGKSIALAGSPFSTTAASRQIILRTVLRF